MLNTIGPHNSLSSSSWTHPCHPLYNVSFSHQPPTQIQTNLSPYADEIVSIALGNADVENLLQQNDPTFPLLNRVVDGCKIVFETTQTTLLSMLKFNFFPLASAAPAATINETVARTDVQSVNKTITSLRNKILETEKKLAQIQTDCQNISNQTSLKCQEQSNKLWDAYYSRQAGLEACQKDIGFIESDLRDARTNASFCERALAVYDGIKKSSEFNIVKTELDKIRQKWEAAEQQLAEERKLVKMYHEGIKDVLGDTKPLQADHAAAKIYHDELQNITNY